MSRIDVATYMFLANTEAPLGVFKAMHPETGMVVGVKDCQIFQCFSSFPSFETCL